jgi:hypothetical protein
MKQGRTEKAVFAKLSTEKVELAQHEKESIALGQKLLTIIRGMEKLYN